jgi:hypothetical protein
MDSRAVQKVILENFACNPQGDIHTYHLKIWGDRYRFIGETNGSALSIGAGRRMLILTSNDHPLDCFQKEQNREAIERRFAVIEMTEKNKKRLKRTRLDTSIPHTGDEDEDEEEDEQGEVTHADEEEWERNNPFKKL